MSSARSHSPWVALLAIPLGLALFSGCGDDSDDVANDPAGSAGSAPSSSHSAAGAMPACGDVWKAGSTIPTRYRGCVDKGTVVKAAKMECASGQVLVTYGDAFYGVLGGPVNPVPGGLKASAKYRHAKLACG